MALALVLIHVGALFVLAPDDALFAMSPDGPTRARMALLATIALVAVVLVGALRRPPAALTAGRKTSEQPRVVPAQGTRGGRECRADKPGMAAKLCASCGCSSAG